MIKTYSGFGKWQLRKRYEDIFMGKKRIAAAVAAACTAVLADAAYVGTAQQYRETFFPGTVINGIPAEKMTIDQVKEELNRNTQGYVLTLVTRTGTQEIRGEDIDLHTGFDGTLEQMMAEQNPYRWGWYLFHEVSGQVQTELVFDEQKLDEVLDGFSFMDEAQMIDPVDAGISDYIEHVGYELIPEQAGTRLDRAAAKSCIVDAIYQLTPELSLDEAGVYAEPEITTQTESLVSEYEELQRYKDMTMIYDIGDQKEIIEGIDLQRWLLTDEAGGLTVDEAQVSAYVNDLASRYDTAYHPKRLKTSYGYIVEITKGNYGWRIDKKKEIAALREAILSGQGEEREPIYLQTAASHTEPDYGDTYVEINLSAQHLFYYKAGQLVVESDFVSGNIAKGHGTPGGAYPITYKQRNATLRGQGYASPVSYWMPFNRGIGMHDASWRSSFGGNIYRTNGSHGCINLPIHVAKTIYENIEAGTAVLCYFESDEVEDAPEPEATTEETAEAVETTEDLGAYPATNVNIEEPPATENTAETDTESTAQTASGTHNSNAKAAAAVPHKPQGTTSGANAAAQTQAETQAAQVETPIESSQPHPAEEPQTASGPSAATASGEIIVPPLIQSGPGADQTEPAMISAVIEANVG
jgi:hypothetical protein